MGRYDRYILAQLAALFGFFSLILISVYWVNDAVDRFDRLISDGQTFMVFLEFSALALPRLMLIVLPVAAFVATLFAFNRLIGESEMVVLQTAGLSALRLLRPVLMFGCLVGLLTALIGNVLAPTARVQLADREQEVESDMTGRFLRQGEFLHPTDGLTVYIRDITELGDFRDVFMHDLSTPGNETTYLAPRALLVAAETGPRMVMFDGMSQSLDLETQRLSIVRFQDFTYDIGALIQQSDARGADIRELPTVTLIGADEALADLLNLPLAQMLFAGHDRIARALFVVFTPLIAAATLMLGSFSRLGLWPQILAAVLIVIPLQAIWNTAEAAALRDADLYLLAYLQPFVAALVALTLAGLAMVGRARLSPGRLWA